MKHLLLILVLSVIISQSFAQNTFPSSSSSNSYNLIRSNVGSSGSSVTLISIDGKYNISQSVGQSGIIGTYTNANFILRQGYQQPKMSLNIGSIDTATLNAKVFPNPFKDLINVVFSENINTEIQVSLYDVIGRRLFFKKYKPSQMLQIALIPDSEGTYFLMIAANQKQFSTKLIKH